MFKRGSILAIVFAAVFSIAGCGGGGNSGGTPPILPAPTFNYTSENFTASLSVTLSDSTAAAAIYYTTNGTTPTTASALYSSAITVTATTTIEAIAVLSGDTNSSVASATYTLAAEAPTFSSPSGSYGSNLSVTLSETTAGASIYYTLDGSTPTSSSTLYGPSILLPTTSTSTTTTIKAIAVATGYANSAVASATYTINLPAATAPTFSTTAPGAYTSAQSVTLADAQAGTSIYYTTDGSVPTIASTLYSSASPINVTATTTINALAVATGYSNSPFATGTYYIGSSVAVVQSSDHASQMMVPQPDLSFTSSTADAGTNTVVVDPTQSYQTIDGFGAAFTDSAAYVLYDEADNLSSTMNDLFTRNGNGIGLSFMRIPMGASDIARSVYSFDDQPVGTTDFPLTGFSISHDDAYILPIIQQAVALNPSMKLMANPWSPPGWMKDPTSMSPVSMMGGSLLMTSANETAFANYFVDYVKAYETAGVPIDFLSIQNEPGNPTTAYPSMGMIDTDQLAVFQGYVLPAFASATFPLTTPKFFAWDHNWDTPSYPQTVLGGMTTAQLSQMAGTAWHGYGGVPGAQQLLQNQFPNLGNWMTEHSGGTWISDQFTNDFIEINEVLRNSGKAYVKWSLALDQNLGPDLTQDAPPLGGCNTCTPIVTVNSSTGDVTKDVEYYTLGHYSKYVLPGATRIYSSNTPSITSIAFTNPDGSTALIAYNVSSSSQLFTVQWGQQSFTYTLPATSAATFTWDATVSGLTPPVSATAQIQGSSFSSEGGLEMETTSDSTGEYDLGYLTNGSYVLIKNVDFGTGSPALTMVNVRTASAGNGGTATFYLDNMTSTPIATAALTVTGGWQTWTTVSGSFTGSPTGKHDLYVVFTGGGATDSISNVNWFQFQ